MARRRAGVATVLDLTPMIDCTFLLIIFFVVSTQVVNDIVPLTPPKAVHANDEDLPPGYTIVNITSQGTVHIGSKRCDLWRDVKLYLKERAKRAGYENDAIKASKLDLYIRGDMIAQWKLVQEVLSICQDPEVKIYRSEFAAVMAK
ncbi:MAG: ExbD/TolR family protein [Planctomycetota bacterium]